MPYSTVVAGTTITASWGNTNVRDQVVTPFATAAARTSAVSAPVEGMLSYRTDGNVFEGYDGTNWFSPPGNMGAWGQRVSSSTATTTEVGVLRLDDVPLISGRFYEIYTSGLAHYSTVGADTAVARLRYSITGTAATTSDTVLTSGNGQCTTGSNVRDTPITLRTPYVPGSNVDLSVLLTIGRVAGTGSIAIFGSATQPINLYVLASGTSPTDTGVDI